MFWLPAILTAFTGVPSTNRGDPGSSRDTHGVILCVHTALPRSCPSTDRAADPGGHVRFSPHRGEYRAGRASSHLRQTSFPHPVRSATERQPSFVSRFALLTSRLPRCPLGNAYVVYKP